MTIVVTGGSGFIGTRLTKKLLDLGHTVIVVDLVSPRFTHERLFFIQCDLRASVLPFNVLERTDAVVNLSGATIAKKWTPEYKELIKESRVMATRHLVESIRDTAARPTVLVSASAIAYYGDTDEVVDEQSPKGEGFLADVVEAWETETRVAGDYGLRVVSLRTAPVIGTGGLLAALTQTARFGFLTKITKRDFWFSWIHEEDVVNAYLFALQTTTLQGVVNAVAPEPVLYQSFMKDLAHAVHRKMIGTVPLFIMKRILGEGYDEATKNARVMPQRLLDKGFEFQYPTIKGALTAVFGKHKK
jgi:uncharacterized protein